MCAFAVAAALLLFSLLFFQRLGPEIQGISGQHTEVPTCSRAIAVSCLVFLSFAGTQDLGGCVYGEKFRDQELFG